MNRIEAQRAKNKQPFHTRPSESAKPTSQPAQSNAPKDKPEFNTGDKVVHAKFGQGIVMSSKLTGADEEVTIAFTSSGVKRLVASMAKLEKA